MRRRYGPPADSISFTRSKARCTSSTSSTAAPSSRHLATRIGVGRLRHHDLGRAAQDLGRVGHRDRVVARAHRGHPAGERVRRQLEHHGQRAARLEGARALEQLLLQDDARARRQRPRQRGIVPGADGRGDDEVAELRARGPDRVAESAGRSRVGGGALAQQRLDGQDLRPVLRADRESARLAVR